MRRVQTPSVQSELSSGQPIRGSKGHQVTNKRLGASPETLGSLAACARLGAMWVKMRLRAAVTYY